MKLDSRTDLFELTIPFNPAPMQKAEEAITKRGIRWKHTSVGQKDSPKVQYQVRASDKEVVEASFREVFKEETEVFSLSEYVVSFETSINGERERQAFESDLRVNKLHPHIIGLGQIEGKGDSRNIYSLSTELSKPFESVLKGHIVVQGIEAFQAVLQQSKSSKGVDDLRETAVEEVELGI